MSDKIINSPQIRFAGFTDTWEQRKLGESVNFLNGRAYKQTELLDSGKYRVLRVGNFNTIDRWYFSDLELEENKYANNGDLLYLWSTNFGPEIWGGEKVVYHYHIWKLDIIRNNLDKQYLYTWLENDKERIKQNTNGTTMVHVTKGNMENREFQVPANLEEQQKIGVFFKQLDETITLHQRKLELLKDTKMSLLQKMFPKDGRDFPEIRFLGFTDAWEQRVLSDVKDVRDGTHDSPKYHNEGHPLVTSKNLTEHGLDMSDVSLISDEDFNAINQRSKVNVGDIIFGMIGTIGNPVILKRNDFAIKNVALIKRDGEVENEFLIQLLKSPVFYRYIRKENVGGTQKFLGLSQIRNFKFLVPSKAEQEKIGKFFYELDNLITLHQRELNSLDNFKKSLLQQMFI
ncbi:restriction endonuclease subunit S [Bacillus pumilus]|uniref:restriction endonuclease subunit S n=1 Tax=Bacillus pumilus TaxID=1408 RepID=UPI002FF72863